MYSKNIRVLLDLHTLFINHETHSTVLMNENEFIYNVDSSNSLYYNKCLLRIINNNSVIIIDTNLGLAKHECENDRNLVSVLTKRLKICMNTRNLYTNVGNNKEIMTISTYDLLNDEENFQYSTVADVPDVDTIQDLCNISNEILDLKYSYNGTYNVVEWNFKKILRDLKSSYPEKDGHYWSLT